MDAIATATAAPAAPAAAPVAAPAPAAAAPAPAAPAAAPAAPAPAKAAAPAAPAPAPAVDDTNEGYWPADWRDTVSKGDAKVLARMSRYASPQAAMEALISAQNRISAGELKPAIGKDSTPEEIASWRKEHGIPEAPDKYDLGADTQGMNKEALSKVLAIAHATNQTPDQVKANLGAIKLLVQDGQERRVAEDDKAKKASEDELRNEWGPEYRRNLNIIHGMLDGSADPTLKDQILQGRMADGTLIGSSPAALKWLASLALIQNPAGVVVPGSEANPMKGVEDEIAKIETLMKTNRKAYDKDEKAQERLRELYGAREKMKR